MSQVGLTTPADTEIIHFIFFNLFLLHRTSHIIFALLLYASESS